MKTVLGLLNEAVEMGFDREKALFDIDMALDEEFGFENREDIAIAEEQIMDSLYNTILSAFKERKMYQEWQEEEEKRKQEEEDSMWKVIWLECGESKRENFETKEQAMKLIKELKENPYVCEEDVWIFPPRQMNM